MGPGRIEREKSEGPEEDGQRWGSGSYEARVIED